MKKIRHYPILLFALTLLFLGLNACKKDTSTYTSYKDYPIYQDTDLGLQYTPTASTFKIWSPTAENARLLLYPIGIGGTPLVLLKFI